MDANQLIAKLKELPLNPGEVDPLIARIQSEGVTPDIKERAFELLNEYTKVLGIEADTLHEAQSILQDQEDELTALDHATNAELATVVGNTEVSKTEPEPMTTLEPAVIEPPVVTTPEPVIPPVIPEPAVEIPEPSTAPVAEVLPVTPEPIPVVPVASESTPTPAQAAAGNDIDWMNLLNELDAPTTAATQTPVSPAASLGTADPSRSGQGGPPTVNQQVPPPPPVDVQPAPIVEQPAVSDPVPSTSVAPVPDAAQAIPVQTPSTIAAAQTPPPVTPVAQ